MSEALPDKFVLSRETADKLRKIIDSQPGTDYEYGPGAQSQMVSILQVGTLAHAAAGGAPPVYAATVQRLLAINMTWVSADVPVYVCDANGGSLISSDYMLGMRVGDYSDDTPLFLTGLTGPYSHGLTATVTTPVVTAVTCTSGTLSVTTKTLSETFVGGFTTAWSCV